MNLNENLLSLSCFTLWRSFSRDLIWRFICLAYELHAHKTLLFLLLNFFRSSTHVVTNDMDVVFHKLLCKAALIYTYFQGIRRAG